MLNHLDRESRKALGDSVVVVIVFVAVFLAFAVSARCEASAALTMPRTDSDFGAVHVSVEAIGIEADLAVPMREMPTMPRTDSGSPACACSDYERTSAPDGCNTCTTCCGMTICTAVYCTGTVTLDLVPQDPAFTLTPNHPTSPPPSSNTPGIREIWAAPTNARDFSPSAEDFARVAGPGGYVVALSPERAEHVVATLEAARDEAAACRLEVDAQAALIDSLRKQVATLEAAHVTDGADILRMDELTRSQRAMLRPRRGLAFVAGMAVGAGLVAGGVAVAR